MLPMSVSTLPASPSPSTRNRLAEGVAVVRGERCGVAVLAAAAGWCNNEAVAEFSVMLLSYNGGNSSR